MAYQKLNWKRDIPVSALTEEQREYHLLYLKAKADFGASLQSSARKGTRIIFSEKFGTPEKPEQSKLSMAAVAISGSKPQAQSTSKSLSEFFDEQDEEGRAS